MFLSVRSSGNSDEDPAVVLAGCSNDNTSCAGHSEAGDGARLHRVPKQVAEECAALACILETSGSAAVPFSVAQMLSWLRVRQSLDRFCGWQLEEVITAAEVAEFLQDSQLDFLAAACATQLVLTRRNGFRSGPQMSLSLDLPAALIRDILLHATRKSALPAVLQQLPASLRPHAAQATVSERTLRPSDPFASANELALFLQHLLPHDSLVLEELQLNSSTPGFLRIPSDHRCSALLSNLLSSQSSLRSVDLSGIVVPRFPGPIPRLGTLQLPGSIQRLVLSRCELGHHPTATLPRLCACLSQLTHLDLSHNALGVLGISALAPVLRRLTCLATLDISSTGIRKEGSVALAPHLATLTALTSLHLASNVIQATGVQALAEVLPMLPLIATLDISGGVFSDAGALSLSPALPRLPSLKHLDLAWSALCDSGVSNLRLGLTAPRVDPPFHPHEGNPVAPMPTGLTYLSLRNNNITPAAIGDLCVICVRLASTLRHLDLSCNRLRWGSGALAGTLTRLHELRVLVLRDTCMRASDFALLAPVVAGLKHLSHFDVSSNQLSSPLSVLLDSIDRKSRETGGRNRTSASGFSCALLNGYRESSSDVQNSPHVAQPPVHPASVAWVSMHADGSEASTSHACTTDDHQKHSSVHCAQCSNVHASHAHASATTCMPSSDACAVNSSLTHLNLSSGFDVDGGDPYEVVGWDVPPVVHDLVREIVNRAVEDIAFGCTGGHSAQRAWRPPTVRLPNLRFLDLSGTSDAFPCISSILTHCSGALESLNLASTGLTASMARTLRDPLAACTRLTSLDISHNACMGAAGGMELAEGLRMRVHDLHVLSVSMCDVGGAVIAEACIAGGTSLVPNACHACKCSGLPARMASDPGVIAEHAMHPSSSHAVSSTACMQPAVSRSAPAPVPPRLVFGKEDKTFMRPMHQFDEQESEPLPPRMLQDDSGVDANQENVLEESFVVAPSHATDASDKDEAVHVPHAHAQRRRVSEPISTKPMNSACCTAHAVRGGVACTGQPSSYTAADTPDFSMPPTQPCTCVGHSGRQPQQNSHNRQLFKLQSLNLKGVALGQTAGVQVLRELAVCAPKLKKLDVGATQLTDGEQVGLVRNALDALTQVTMLGISQLSL